MLVFTIVLFSGVKITLGWCNCVSFQWVLFFTVRWVVFLLGSGTRIIKRVGKKVNIGRPYKYLAYTYFVCGFLFFLLVFSLGFMFAYLLSLGSSFVKRLADLGGHRCADFWVV